MVDRLVAVGDNFVFPAEAKLLADSVVETTTKKQFTAAERTQLAGITVEWVQDIIGALVTAGTGISVVYNDAANTFVISNTGGSGGGGLDAETVRDTVAAFVVAGTGINVTHNDAGDTLTVSMQLPSGGTAGKTLVLNNATSGLEWGPVPMPIETGALWTSSQVIQETAYQAAKTAGTLDAKRLYLRIGASA